MTGAGDEGGGGGAVDIWIHAFASGTDPVADLQRVFGIDEARAVAIQQTVPRAVKRSAPVRDAEQIAAALRAIGAKVELRPSRGARESGTGMARPDARSSSDALPRLERRVRSGARSSGAGLSLPVPSSPEPLPEPPTEPRVPAPSAHDDAPGAGGTIELAFEPAAVRPRPSRPAVHAPETPPIAPAPQPAPASSGGALPRLSFTLPGWARGLGVVSGLGVMFFLVRAGRCACAFSDMLAPATPEELARLEAEANDEALAGAIELEAFLARPTAMLGRDVDRNLGFARALERAGASRVLVSDVIRVTGGDVALTLIVALPASPGARRRILMEIARYESGGETVRPEGVELPPASVQYEFVDLE